MHIDAPNYALQILGIYGIYAQFGMCIYIWQYYMKKKLQLVVCWHIYAKMLGLYALAC